MLTITITGIRPIGVQSVRFAKGHAFQDPVMREYKDNIKSNILANLPSGFEMYQKGVPIRVALTFFFAEKNGNLYVRPHVGKPDIDNLCKGVFDAGNKVLWYDDKQIAACRPEKYIGGEDRITIEVERIY
jgi:crossover junction endodeoxyribonuclease RusA